MNPQPHGIEFPPHTSEILYTKDHETDLLRLLGMAAAVYIDASNIAAATLAANNINALGTHADLSATGKTISDAAEHDQQQAIEQLVTHVTGYQTYMERNLRTAYGDDTTAITDAWTAAWTILSKSLSAFSVDQTERIQGLFDDLIATGYFDTYDCVVLLDGTDTRNKIADRTFRETMFT